MIRRLFGKKKQKQAKGQCERTLCDAQKGECVRISCLMGDVAACHRLREMGFCESSFIEKINGEGALICKVCDKQVVISETLARNIIVENPAE